MKVAIVYDRVNKWGGAERVLLALHKLFPDAPLYTSVYKKKNARWADVFEVKKSFLQKFPFARSSHESYAYLMPLAFESFSFDGYDLVISVTSEAAKGIITKPETVHVCYCLTPTRYLWSGYKDYFTSRIFQYLTYPVVSYLRAWDKKAAFRPDYMIAISQEVKKRITRYYERDSVVIYPPVEFLPEKADLNGKSDYFLVVSRLTPYKKIGVAINAANRLKVPLKVVGAGSDFFKLKSEAGPTVEFTGNVSDKRLREYYRNCKALIFPGVEDFGLVMVEAQAFGKPVIAYAKGAALEIIKKGLTGEFFDQQSPESLIKVLEKFDHKSYNSQLCRKNAERFSYNSFKKQMVAFLEQKMEK